jgi:signal transduction histidine kinase
VAQFAAENEMQPDKLDAWMRHLGVERLERRTPDGQVTLARGRSPDMSGAFEQCKFDPALTVELADEPWSIACASRSDAWVLVGSRPAVGALGETFRIVAVLATVVGIIVALGVLQMMSPLSRISAALEQVGRGERGVRLAETGLSELDALIERLNAAAQTVEEREDAIVARLKVVQDMARLVAHEVRNPLQSIELYTALLADEHDGSERRSLAGQIHTEISQLNEVVSRFLRGARDGTLVLHRTQVNVAAMLERTVTFLRPAARDAGVHLHIGTATRTPAFVDEVLLGRAIENLVTNALHALAGRHGLIRLAAHDAPGSIVLVVEDDGPGVPDDIQSTLFERYVSRRAGGTGLGLSLVREVLQAHGGTIGYSTSPLGGARFTAVLPTGGEGGAHQDSGGR